MRDLTATLVYRAQPADERQSMGHYTKDLNGRVNLKIFIWEQYNLLLRRNG